VTRITFKRTRNGVIVRWRRVAGALDYVVSIALGAGSARKYVVLTGPPRLGPSRILRALRRGQSARLQIRALAATGQLGAWGTARYSRH
jgi:hypothetical protein